MRQLRGFAMSPRSNGDPTPDPVPRAGQSAPPGGLGGGGISRQPQAHQRMAYAAASRVRCAGLRPPWTRRRAAIIERRSAYRMTDFGLAQQRSATRTGARSARR